MITWIKNVNKKTLCLTIATVILIISAATAYIHYSGQSVSTDDAAIDGQTVVLSPKVAGYIKTIYINDNQTVKAGDIIMQIDPKDYQLQVNNAKAALSAAKAALAAAQDNAAATSITVRQRYDQPRKRLILHRLLGKRQLPMSSVCKC